LKAASGKGRPTVNKTFDQGKEDVAKLCHYFATNHQAFLAPTANEAQIRQALIDPLFEALGWDVHNSQHHAPQFMEVVYNPSLDDEGERKEPDYAFRAGQTVMFFAEAKKCDATIKTDPRWSYQLRRYGWSAKVAVSILTDFEELGVYDCTFRPRQSDKASRARIQYFRFEEYADRWRELWDIFSREAVWSGAFDQYAASKRKRGTSEVDVEFLEEIEKWRDQFARNIALRNHALSDDELNRAVQLTIDRIVFLRMAEDRGLEPFDQLSTMCERPGIYERFMLLCRKADDKYNSGLFHFQKEAAFSEPPDSITPRLSVDDKVLKPILQSLYYDHGSPYVFKVLPVEILGTVYERFLGKVIRLTPGHQAKVEPKPDVRKAGGVYYTPAYIVDYIVRQTVASQIEGKSPAQLAGKGKVQPLRVLDMACGSGSFLLGGYRCLLDHCLKWYVDNGPRNFPDAVYEAREGDWRLSIAEKKRILTTHVFGVDIDPQAVEVSKLSLLLKVLEGESAQTVGRQLELIHIQRMLPNLSENIKCGNSLIGPDYFTGRLIPDTYEFTRVNAFDWKREFPAAISAGGFDCVIGNPPYGAELTAAERSYLCAAYHNQTKTCDTFELFLLQGARFLNRGGRISMIIPASWLTGEKYHLSRRCLLNSMCPVVAYALPFDVFKDAYIDTAIVVVAEDSHGETCLVHCFPKKQKLSAIPDFIGLAVPVKSIREDPLNRLSIVFSGMSASIMRKISSFSLKLGDWFDIQRGVQPYSRAKHSEDQIARRFLHSKDKKSKGYLPELQGNELSRYRIEQERKGYIRYCDEIASSRPLRMFTGKRIALRRLLTRKFRLQAALTSETMITTDNVLNLVPKANAGEVEFALALLNSKLLSWLYVNSSMVAQKDDFPQVHISALSGLPIPTANDAASGRMAKLVGSMQAMHKQLASAKGDSQRGAIQRQIEATDAEIDRMVYELYGLTKEEIAILEERVRE
jgi:hypothetical protein